MIEVFARLADDLGVVVTDADHHTVLEDWRDGQRRGVKGSPHYFCNGSGLFTGEPPQLEAFLDSCL